MRSLRLLLSAGAILSLVAGSASASRILDQEGNPATPTGTGVVNELDGFQEMGSPYTGGQGLEGETAAPFSVPAPGTINMRINSFVNEFPMMTWFSGQNGNGTPGSNAGNKIQGMGIYGWIRIDLGIDGQTKNGIKYGAFTEIRENNTTNVTGGPTSLNGGFGQSASGDSSGNTLYVRHAFTYIGTDQLGFLRIGTGITAMTLYETGLNDDFDIGGWISFASSNIPSNMVPIWPWADEGGQYMAGAITYTSPVIAGFDGGLSYVPNNSGPFDGSGCSAPYGGVGCATQSSSVFTGDVQNRYRNELSIALRYRNSFGPVGMNLSGIYSFSGTVNNNGTTNGTVNGISQTTTRYKGLSIGDLGASFSLFRSWNIEGNVMWGNFNGNWALQPEGGKDALAWVVGTKYTIMQAPLTIGAYYFNYRYNGLATALLPGMGARTSRGLDVGAVYGLGPGVVLIAEYAWGENSQTGFNFLQNTAGNFNSNKVWAQVLTAGMSVRF
jgi:hypothetical protein